MTINCCDGYVPQYLNPEDRVPRDSHAYALIKIDALSSYCKSAQQVFKSAKLRGFTDRLIYFEPFAGPGWNKIRETGVRVKGTPLKAIEKLTEFDVFIFNDLKKEIIDALYSELMDLKVNENPKVEVYLFNKDANDVVLRLQDLPLSGKNHYPYMGIALIDPVGLHLRWESVETLSKARLDLLLMLPTGIDLARNLPKSGLRLHITRWLGEPLPSNKLVEVVRRYEEKLKTLYPPDRVLGTTTSEHPEQHYVRVENAYYLVFATHCPKDIATRIWEGVCKMICRNQGKLALFDEIF